MNSTRYSSLFLAAALLATSACTPNKDDKPPAPKVSGSSGDATAMPATMAALPKLGTAPEWTMTDLSGKPVTAAELKGKVVVVDFWATWCPPCRAEIPDYIAMQTKYGKDGLVIVGASIDTGGPEVVKAFADKIGINYTMLMADEAVVAAFGGVNAVPTTFLIDRDGQIRDKKEGLEEHYESKVAAVVNEKA